MTRGLVALAMLAALLVAPRPVSAAVNDFPGAQVSPPAGTVTTIFVMRVSYKGGFPATGVTVTVAGTTRPMAPEQGTLSAGTWFLATTLPAGTRTPTFAASVLRGPSPTRVGPTDSVAELGVTGGAPAPGTRRAGASDAGGGTAGNGAAASPNDRFEQARAGTPGAGTAPPDRDGEGAAPGAGDEVSPTRGRSGSPVVQDELLGMVLVIGLIGVATVALVGTLLLAAGRRRHDPEEPAAVVVGAAPEATATDDTRTRRTLQRARMRMVDDPIVSALGIDEQMQARRDRRARLAATEDRTPGDA